MNAGIPRIICITGGIGAGKSIVASILRLKGFNVYDCDSRAKHLMQSDLTLRKSLTGILGDGIYNADGCLRRKEAAERIFASAETRLAVNAVVHEAVRCDIRDCHARCQDRLFFVETAIPAASRIDEMCDSVWLVDAPTEIRISRACIRDEAERRQVMMRIESQKDEFSHLPTQKTSVIVNDGTAPLLPRIDHLIETELNKPIQETI